MSKPNHIRAETVYRYISEYIRQKGYPPSYREIADGCELSSSSIAQRVVRELEQAGRVSTARGKMRTIVITDNGKDEGNG